MSLGPMRVPRLPAVLASATGTSTSAPVVIGLGFEHYAFQLTGTFTGFSVQVFGTLDPNVLLNNAGIANTTGGVGTKVNPNYPAPGAAGGAWALVPAPSEQSGTGNVSNPLTNITQLLETKIPFVAFCFVFTGTSPTGTCNVVGWSID